jgi:hypothetical protein
MAKSTENRWGAGTKDGDRWKGNRWEEDRESGERPVIQQQEPWEDILNTAKDVTYMTQVEKEIIFEYNKVRWDPKRYAQEVIEPSKKWFSGKTFLMGGKYKVVTREGVAAVDACLKALEGYSKSGPYLWAKPFKEFYEIALLHASDQSKTGGMGHIGSDGKNTKQRILSLTEEGSSGYGDGLENIGYGQFCNQAQLLLHLLLVDDGLLDRGHQKNIFVKSVNQIGCSVKSHPKHGLVAVQILGYGMVPKSK